MAATSVTPASSSSGTIDVQSLVSQLMAVEQQPITTLSNEVASYQTKISTYGAISGLVSSFQTALENLTISLPGNIATPSDTSVFSASADSTAVSGNYSLNVTSLAQSQNLVAAGQTSSTAAIGGGTATTVTFDFGTISGGTLTSGIYSGATFTSNGNGTKSITIDSTNNTLQGISAAINAANMGVTATIVNDGSGMPYRLALTSNSGISNSLKITTSGGDGTINSLLSYDPAGTQNLKQTAAAQNANFQVNGIAITNASNTITSAVQGVTLTLNNVTTNPVTLAVTPDTNGISTAVSSVVTAYNALSSALTADYSFGNNTTQAGPLAGDGTISLMQNELRSIFNTAATGGTLSYLAQVGVTTQGDGTLKLDSTQLNSAMTNNLSDVNNLLSSFATRLDSWSTSILSPGNGLIATKTASLNTFINNFNDQITTLQSRLPGLQSMYTTQYTNLNMLLTSMNATSAYLTQQFSKGTSS
jgi:flagellar hook-associated protein 2